MFLTTNKVNNYNSFLCRQTITYCLLDKESKQGQFIREI
jgi:hypothetical protein